MDDGLDTSVTMSMTGSNFVEIEHGLGYLPFNVIVRVNATDGSNRYFNFPAMGSVAVDGSEVNERYGGKYLLSMQAFTCARYEPSHIRRADSRDRRALCVQREQDPSVAHVRFDLRLRRERQRRTGGRHTVVTSKDNSGVRKEDG